MGGPEPDVVEEPVRAPPQIRPVEPTRAGGPTGAVTGVGNRALTRVIGGRASSKVASWYQSDDPLKPYAVFKAASPAGYAALEATAKRYVLRLTGDQQSATPETGWRTQTEVPLVSLLRPALPPYGALLPLKERLYPLLTGEDQDTKAIAGVLSEELVGDWSTRNDALLSSQVAVRLLLPDEAPSGFTLAESGLIEVVPQEVLEFSLNGRQLRTLDGSLDLVSLDLLGSNDLEASVAKVAGEALVISRAADYRRVTEGLLVSETRYWEDVAAKPEAFAMNDVLAHIGLVQVIVIMDATRLPEGGLEGPWAWRLQGFLSEHPEYTAEFSPLLDGLRTLADLAVPAYQTYASWHESESMPDLEFAEFGNELEAPRERGTEAWEEGSYFVAVCEFMGWGLGEVIWGTGNMVSGDYFEARRQGLQAFRRGDISKNQLDELTEAAAGRALISVAVFAALTLATAGLAGPVLGTAAGLGRTMLFAGASNAIVTAGTMTTTSVYTRQKDFADPTLAGIWGASAYSAEQIALGAAVAGVIGAAVPVAGMALSKAAGWVRSLVPTRSVALSLRSAGLAAPDAPLPAGWTGEEISAGMFRLTHPEVPGEIILTAKSMRYQSPTGTGGMRVEFELPLDASVGGRAALPPLVIGPDDVEAALAGGFRAEGPLVSSPPGGPVLDIGSGPAPANLGLGDEALVIIVRTDVVDTFPIDRVLNAEGVLAEDLVNSAQAVIINNPYNYRPNLAELGRAVRPGGKIIIQGHREANKYFRGLLKQGPPKGFKLSPEEGFDPVVDLTPAAQAHPDVMTDAIRRNILGGPFRSTSPEGRAPQPNVRVVYEKPIKGAEELGKQLGRDSKGTGSRFDYVCRGLNALQLGQRNAADAASAATVEMGLSLIRTNVGDDILLVSVRQGPAQPILIVKPDGTVLRGTADLTVRTPVDPNQPFDLANIIEQPPLLPGR